MTSRLASKIPLIQAQRQLSAQAQAAPSMASLKSSGVQISKADNGLTLISNEDTPGSLATLAMVVKSGPRYESYDDQGISHCMRIAAGLCTHNFTSFSVFRNIQQAGSSLVCAQGREHFLYATQLQNSQVDNVIDYFVDAVGNQAFKPWEISDNVFRMELENNQLDPETRANELLHKAAYRRGLGYSLYSPEYKIGNHKPAAMQAFYNQTFTCQRSALIGIGISQNVLNEFAGLVNMESGEGPNEKSKYIGGEQREDCGGKFAHVSLAGETPNVTGVKDRVVAMFLQKVLGSGPHVKWCSGQSKIIKNLGNPCQYDITSKGVNFTYSDTGLLGVSVMAEASKAGKVVEAAAANLRSLTVSQEEFTAAKNTLLVEIADNINNQLVTAECYGLQVLCGQEIAHKDSVIQAIQSVTLGDVQAAAKKLSSGKLSMGAVGNLNQVPYLDSL